MTTRYNPEHMRRFREARPDLDELPDDVVATLLQFALFAFGESVRDLGRDLGPPLKETTDDHPLFCRRTLRAW